MICQGHIDSLIDGLPQSESSNIQVALDSASKTTEKALTVQDFSGLHIVEAYIEPFDWHPYFLYFTILGFVLLGTVVPSRFKDGWFDRNKYWFLYAAAVLVLGIVFGMIHYSSPVRSDLGLVIISAVVFFFTFGGLHVIVYPPITKMTARYGILGYFLSIGPAFGIAGIFDFFGIQQNFMNHSYWEWVYAAGMVGIANLGLMIIFKAYQNKKQIRTDKINKLTGRQKDK